MRAVMVVLEGHVVEGVHVIFAERQRVLIQEVAEAALGVLLLQQRVRSG